MRESRNRRIEAIAYLLEDLIDNDTESARARLDDVPGDWRERMAPLLDQ